jgi:AcrR family transcriptional regulator
LLMQALLDLLAAESFQSISVHSITDRAGINRATFYAHFADKYALLDYVIRETFRQALGDTLPEAADLSPDTLRQLVVATWEYLSRFNSGCHPADRQFQPTIEAQVQAELYDLILGWLTQATLPDARPPEVVASLVSWGIFGLALQWAREDRQVVDGMVEHAIDLILTGLSADSEPTAP